MTLFLLGLVGLAILGFNRPIKLFFKGIFKTVGFAFWARSTFKKWRR